MKNREQLMQSAKLKVEKEKERLRDEFAMRAMQGAISNPNFSNKKGNKDFPKDCYALADAMMEARK